MLLRLWCRPAAAALIRPLAWEPPDATGAALKRKKEKKRNQKSIYFTTFSNVISIKLKIC